MKARELREMANDQLLEELRKVQERLLRDVRIRVASGEGVNAHEARACRRDIARIRTILRERELNASAAKGGGAKA